MSINTKYGLKSIACSLHGDLLEPLLKWRVRSSMDGTSSLRLAGISISIQEKRLSLGRRLYRRVKTSRNCATKDVLHTWCVTIAWEHTLDHHDPATDIFSLGMILASLALQLDFHDAEDLQKFITHRGNLFELNHRLHPTLAQTIVQMTELYRGKRSQDLQAIQIALENYRDHTVSLDLQLALDKLLAPTSQKTRTEMILPRLRDRLFDLTRRNPLLNFRSSSQTLNLTQHRCRLTIHVNNIRADQLFLWNKEIQSQVAKGKSIRLNQWINFNEAMYAPSVLERLIADARRDKNEFGCSQLRLVAVSLDGQTSKRSLLRSSFHPWYWYLCRSRSRKGFAIPLLSRLSIQSQRSIRWCAIFSNSSTISCSPKRSI